MTPTRTVVKAIRVVETPIGYQRPPIAWNGLTVTDLFCGAGGSSSGLVAAGFASRTAAVEPDGCAGLFWKFRDRGFLSHPRTLSAVAS